MRGRIASESAVRIRRWEKTNVVEHVTTAFSRDSAEPYYVQHALVENADHVWEMLDHGAHVYVCGNKTNLDRSIDWALRDIATSAGGLSADKADQFLQDMIQGQRLHKELY